MAALLAAAGLFLLSSCTAAAHFSLSRMGEAPAGEGAFASAKTPAEKLHYADVGEEDPAWPAIEYMVCQGVLRGAGETEVGKIFAPEEPVSRADAVTALRRMAGSSQTAYGGELMEEAPADPSAPAVWALGTGADSGEEDFRPDDPLTRAQLAALLRSYAQAVGASTDASGDLSPYWDAAAVADPDVLPLSWAVESGIFAPLVSAELHPDYPVTRSQLAQTLAALNAHCAGDPEAAAIARAQTQAAVSRSRTGHAAIQEAVDAAAREYGAVGLQVAVIEHGEVTDAYSCGYADKVMYAVYDTDTGETVCLNAGQMTPQHKMRAASITKVAIGMTAMALAERGVVDLDASIGEYWGFPVKNPYYPDTPVTIRSILSHTSSIPIYGEDVSRYYGPVSAKLAECRLAGLEPGALESWGYNNYAFSVLGMTLELADGRVMDDMAGEYFFDPLDMDAAFEAGEVENTDLLSNLYEYDGAVSQSVSLQKLYRLTPEPGAKGVYFAGGLTTSSTDLAKLVAVLANDGAYEGRRLLSAASVEALESPIGTPAGEDFQQCHPLRLQEDIYGRDRLYYHTGSAYGVYNCISYDPDTGDGVVVLTTGASGVKDDRGIYAVCGRINQAVYAAIAGEGGE